MSERYPIGTRLTATHIDRTITIVEYVGLNAERRHRYKATRDDLDNNEDCYYTEDYLKKRYILVEEVPEKSKRIGKYKITRR